jgi:hypothetical protein
MQMPRLISSVSGRDLFAAADFVAIMRGVHFVGFGLWKRQLEADEKRAKVPSIGGVGSNGVPHGLCWLIVLRQVFLLLWSLML